MVTIEQVERGISEYLDAQLMPRLPKNSIYRIIIGTSASIAVKRAGNAIEQLTENPIIHALGIIDDDNCIDIDIILNEAREQIPDDGIRLQSNKFGKLDVIITKSDVDDLHRYIIRG